MSVQIMLGPQATAPNLRQAIESLDVRGPIITITAGWQDSEGDVDYLHQDIGRPVEDLLIYQQAEEIFAREPQFQALHRGRQGKLRELQDLYRIRLQPAMLATRKLLRSTGNPELVKLEQRAAISQVRALDRHHVRRITAIHEEFDQRRAHLKIPNAVAKRDAVRKKVEAAGLILIAGGHVAVLLNRIRLFRLEELLAQKPIIAWSAGAMVLSERIVLFHDDAPQGKRDAEILDAGLGIVRSIIPLPHAKTRLDWSSRTRMALFSRRFSPARCCTLDGGSMIRLDEGRVTAAEASSIITRTGKKRELVVR